MSEEKTPVLPEVKFNRNGYEIRTQVLQIANERLHQEFSHKWRGWETVFKVDMSHGRTGKVAIPEYPGVDAVLSAAEQLYKFVEYGSIHQNLKDK